MVGSSGTVLGVSTTKLKLLQKENLMDEDGQDGRLC